MISYHTLSDFASGKKTEKKPATVNRVYGFSARFKDAAKENICSAPFFPGTKKVLTGKEEHGVK